MERTEFILTNGSDLISKEIACIQILDIQIYKHY